MSNNHEDLSFDPPLEENLNITVGGELQEVFENRIDG